MIQAYKISEELLVPSMVVLDGFVLSHTAEAVEIPFQETVDQFLPTRVSPYMLDVDPPASFGGLLGVDHYQEVRKKLHTSLKAALQLCEKTESEWKTFTGHSYGILDSYRCEDADVVLLTMATASSTSRIVIDNLRLHGIKAGRIKVKMFRPFPDVQLSDLLRGKSNSTQLVRFFFLVLLVTRHPMIGWMADATFPPPSDIRIDFSTRSEISE